MKAVTSAINVQVNTSDKELASKILQDLGLNMSTAINMFLVQIIKKDGIPFEITNPKPSKDTLRALDEARKIIENPNMYPCYDNRQSLKEALLSDD